MIRAENQLSFDDMAPSPSAFTTITPVAASPISLPFHELANLFPPVEGPEFAELVADVKAHGVLDPIWLYEGQVLDGRNRYRACEALGLPCPSRVYDGDDPIGFVLSLNMKRRHLTESQRGMIAARLATLEGGRPSKTAGIPAVSQSEAAQMLNISRDTAQQARKVQREGAPEVVKAVEAGVMTLSAALPLTTLPKEDQPAAWDEVQKAVDGKKPTATSTKAVVNRVQVVATVKEQMADGKTAHDAVKHALQRHGVDTPTPALADAIAHATNHQVTLRATDDRSHDGRTLAERAAHKAHSARVYALRNALETLATWGDLAESDDEGEVVFDQALLKAFVAEMSDLDVDYVEPWLSQALERLTQFATLLQQAHQPPPEEAPGPRQSQIQLAYDQVLAGLPTLGKVISIKDATRNTDVLPQLGYKIFERLTKDGKVRRVEGKKGHYTNLCRRPRAKKQAEDQAAEHA